MSDHVMLSVGIIVGPEKCIGISAEGHPGIETSSSDQAMEASPLWKGEAASSASSFTGASVVSKEVISSSPDVPCVGDGGLEGTICTAAVVRARTGMTEKYHDAENEVEEAVPLLQSENTGANHKQAVVPVESVPNGSKTAIDAPAFAECRICQEEDDISNLESPCACSGSLKFAHRKCVQHWCNEKGDTVCEICQKPFEGGYAAVHQTATDSFPVNIGAGWDITTGQPTLFALTTDHHFLEGEYDEYAGSHANSAAFFRSVALILVALLLVRHLISMIGVGDDEDLSTFFMLSFVRAAGFLIPCYVMARAMHAFQIRQQQQEAALAAAEVTHMIQAGRFQGALAAEP